MKINCVLTALPLLIFILSGCSKNEHHLPPDTPKDLSKHFGHFNVNGTFVLYDANNAKYTYANKDDASRGYIPASTFKICNSLIGLETGVIKDENFVLPWDSIQRQIPAWNADQDLRSAFRNSTVWYYQEVARRIGGQKMKHWLDTLRYGNADTSGGIDKFWLNGGLRISPEQQIDFLRRLRDNALPLSQRSMDIVRSIMIMKDTLGYVVRGKTGWGIIDNENFGWYVGYVETNGNVYYFANCIRSTGEADKNFAKARTEIVSMMLNELGIIKE